MIDFHLDSRSGVSPYLQLVQQVRHALRLGLLREGDQLPTVKEVVGAARDQPEHRAEGLPGARARRSGRRAARRRHVRHRLARRRDRRARAAAPGARGWFVKARRAGLDEESIEALFRDAFRVRRIRGGSVSSLLTPPASASATGAGGRCATARSRSPPAMSRARRAQRRRQDDAAAPRGRPDRTERRDRSRCSAGSPPHVRRSSRGSVRRAGHAAYASLSVADHLRLGARLNPRWDAALARADRRLGPRPEQRAGTLSGGQRAQLALTLAIAKRPELLVLDEPVASLDPLARREFLQTLMEFAAEHEVTVLLSSHLVADLERVCDYLIVLAAVTGPARRRGRRAARDPSPAERPAP